VYFSPETECNENADRSLPNGGSDRHFISHPHHPSCVMRFSQRLQQSDCCNQIANDDLADVKNNIYGEKSAKMPIPL